MTQGAGAQRPHLPPPPGPYSRVVSRLSVDRRVCAVIRAVWRRRLCISEHFSARNIRSSLPGRLGLAGSEAKHSRLPMPWGPSSGAGPSLGPVPAVGGSRMPRFICCLGREIQVLVTLSAPLTTKEVFPRSYNIIWHPIPHPTSALSLPLCSPSAADTEPSPASWALLAHSRSSCLAYVRVRQGGLQGDRRACGVLASPPTGPSKK